MAEVVFPHNTDLSSTVSLSITRIINLYNQLGTYELEKGKAVESDRILLLGDSIMLYPTPIAKLIDSFSKLRICIGIKTSLVWLLYHRDDDDDVNEFAIYWLPS